MSADKCPFCGNEWCSLRSAGSRGVFRQVYCRDADCGARGPERPSEDHAIAAWNNRTAHAETKLELRREREKWEKLRMWADTTPAVLQDVATEMNILDAEAKEGK